MAASKQMRSNVGAGYVLHIVTASGVVAGMVALQAVIDGRLRDAMIWLLICQIVDGLDGPLARKIDIHINAPLIDGHILDLVVDYMTCVAVPVAFLARSGLLHRRSESIIATLILITSALWYARTDQETEDAWFNGFPSSWNLVVPTFLIVGATPTTVAVASIALIITQLTNFKIPHLVRVKEFQKTRIVLAILYLADLTYLSWNYKEDVSPAINIQMAYLLIFPAVILILSIRRTWFYQKLENK